jgi:hypothetical protein
MFILNVTKVTYFGNMFRISVDTSPTSRHVILANWAWFPDMVLSYLVWEGFVVLSSRPPKWNLFWAQCCSMFLGGATILLYFLPFLVENSTIVHPIISSQIHLHITIMTNHRIGQQFKEIIFHRYKIKKATGDIYLRCRLHPPFVESGPWYNFLFLWVSCSLYVSLHKIDTKQNIKCEIPSWHMGQDLVRRWRKGGLDEEVKRGVEVNSGLSSKQFGWRLLALFTAGVLLVSYSEYEWVWDVSLCSK